MTLDGWRSHPRSVLRSADVVVTEATRRPVLVSVEISPLGVAMRLRGVC